MSYTQPMVYKINAFDVDSQDTIPQLKVGFTGLENAPSTIDCITTVYDNGTGNEVVTGGIGTKLELQSTSNGLSLYMAYGKDDYELTPSVKTDILKIFNSDLVNGNSYYLTITLPTEVTESDPIVSNGVIFSCYNTPEFYNFNVSDGDTIRQGILKLDFNYRQTNDVELNWYQCDLYRANNELEVSSGKLYDENYIYTFNNLVNGVSYYIVVSGSTIDGFDFETPQISFNVSYQVIPDSTIIKLENIPEEGYIKVNSKFNLIPGEINNADLGTGEINLKNTDSNVIWSEGLDINYNPLTLKVWGRDFVNNKKIVNITNSENENEFINITANVGSLNSQTAGGNIKLEGNNVNYISASVKANNKYFGMYYDSNDMLYYVVYSLDLVNWYYAYSSGNKIATLHPAYGNWMFGYINNYYYLRGNTRGQFWRSLNGTTDWVEIIVDVGIPTSLLYDGTYYYLFGTEGMAYSDSYNFSNPTINLGTSYAKYNVTYVNGKYIGLDYDGKLCYSLDMNNWNLCTDENGAGINIANPYNKIDIIYYKNNFILFYMKGGIGGGLFSYHSNNGIDWAGNNKVSNSAYFQSNPLWKLIILSNCLLCIGMNSGVEKYEINYSYDGLNWNLLFTTNLVSYRYGFPVMEAINDNLHVNIDVENIFDFTYSNIGFTINAKGLNNDEIITSVNSPALSDIHFYDWLYIGAQITLDNNDSDTVQSVSITAINQADSPGGV